MSAASTEEARALRQNFERLRTRAVADHSDTPEEDVLRRDFTVNGMLLAYTGADAPTDGLRRVT